VNEITERSKATTGDGSEDSMGRIVKNIEGLTGMREIADNRKDKLESTIISSQASPRAKRIINDDMMRFKSNGRRW